MNGQDNYSTEININTISTETIEISDKDAYNLYISNLLDEENSDESKSEQLLLLIGQTAIDAIMPLDEILTFTSGVVDIYAEQSVEFNGDYYDTLGGEYAITTATISFELNIGYNAQEEHLLVITTFPLNSEVNDNPLEDIIIVDIDENAYNQLN